MLPEDQLILVDKNDSPVGSMGKMETHEKGLLHRAFSIIVINEKKEVLLQKRAVTKYHSGGLWTNTCCGHPREGEDTESAAHRRLHEEMGFDCQFHEVMTCIYRADLDHGLQEHEYLHVFVGTYSDAPSINPEEADDWKFMDLEALKTDINTHPNDYTYWFKVVMQKIQEAHVPLL